MPVRSLHPTSTCIIEVLVHRTASDFLSVAWPALSKRESTANIIFPCALQRRSLERAIPVILPIDGADKQLTSPRGIQSNAPSLSPNTAKTGSSDGYLWFTCWSRYEGRSPYLDIVLSCTEGSFGPQPIFLWSSLAPSQTTREYLEPRIVKLVDQLSVNVPATRVFSVFGLTLLTKIFSTKWSHVTAMRQMVDPLYAAKLLYATRETLTECSTLPPGDSIRPGSPRDILAIGRLCKEFSETSVWYPLSLEEAVQEAAELVFNRQVWVYETDERRIATIAAVARISPNVATITKVYTCATRRKRGCAERLVRKVVREMLYTLGKQRVVLYVGNVNTAAKVYNRVGFLGMQGESSMEEVEECLEVGFRGTCRGHW